MLAALRLGVEIGDACVEWAVERQLEQRAQGFVRSNKTPIGRYNVNTNGQLQTAHVPDQFDHRLLRIHSVSPPYSTVEAFIFINVEAGDFGAW